MQKGLSINSWRLLPTLLMLFALSWLTISLPYVYESMQLQRQIEKQEKLNDNPLTNTNEEKTESGVPTISEYLHDIHSMTTHFVILDKVYKCHSSELYFAFHPELISPPPEA
jgi:Tfp pilus assembly protein PilO